jgi:hypothetical protein
VLVSKKGPEEDSESDSSDSPRLGSIYVRHDQAKGRIAVDISNEKDGYI